MLVAFTEITYNDSILQWNVDTDSNKATLILPKDSEDASLVKQILSHLDGKGFTGIRISDGSVVIDDFSDFCKTNPYKEIGEGKSHQTTAFFKPPLTRVDGQRKLNKSIPTQVEPFKKEENPDIIHRPIFPLGNARKYLSFDAIVKSNSSIWGQTGVYREEMLSNNMKSINRLTEYEIISPEHLLSLLHFENNIEILVERQNFIQSLEVLMNQYICWACRDFSEDEMAMAADFYCTQLYRISTLENLDDIAPPLAFASLIELSPDQLRLMAKIQESMDEQGLLEGFKSELESLQKHRAKLHKVNLQTQASATEINQRWAKPEEKFAKYERLSALIKKALKKKSDVSIAMTSLNETLSDSDYPIDTRKIDTAGRKHEDYFIRKGTMLHAALQEISQSKHGTAKLVKRIAEVIREHNPAPKSESSESLSPGPSKSV